MWIIKYLFKKSNFGLIKSELFSFVKHIDNLDEYMNEYVLKHQKYIKKFYLEQKKDEAKIITKENFAEYVQQNSSDFNL